MGDDVRGIEVVAIRMDPLANTPAMRLREVDGTRREFDIFIGAPEASSIHTAMEGAEMPRPLTHDLFVLTLQRLDVAIAKVCITEVVDGTYYAEMHLETSTGVHVISCRPSDGVAIAVRAECPIYASGDILDAVGEAPEGHGDEDILEEFKDFIENINPEDFGR
ncbi:MAG: bifunctional nuclease family protein [Ilumatobacteraceae bacterium]|jgi:bifunctional DNase/RNase|nr:bifunctional nuclease family protein [Ilumatobacteraceae bacterium]